MKILYTSEIFNDQKYGGISRYFVELIDNLDADIKHILPLIISNNEYLRRKKITKNIRLFPNKDFKRKRKTIKSANKIAFKIACAKRNFDIVHPTYYDPSFLSRIGSTPFVLTVHDMIHELYPHLYKGDKTSENKRLLCEKAAKIIAISENTKRDLVNILNIDPNKIEVIYHGNNIQRYNNSRMALELPEKYILFTGVRKGYKNFNRFVEAFSKLDKEYMLICTGSKFTSQERELIDKLGIQDRVSVMYVSDKDLAELYSRASLFVFPSEYEGFGIPILEAFACDCPIALSNTSCFPEIAQDGGGYFDPLCVDSIYQTMRSILEDETMRETLIKNGREQLSRFSWQKTARETCAVYRSII